MSSFGSIDRLRAIRIWDGIVAQAVEGERTTLAIIELEPNTAVPEHSHDNEQLGVCLTGSMRFRIGEERRDVGPGDTWRIRSGVPHEVVAGAGGALAVECFTPVRVDWAALEHLDGHRPQRWPA